MSIKMYRRCLLILLTISVALLFFLTYKETTKHTELNVSDAKTEDAIPSQTKTAVNPTLPTDNIQYSDVEWMIISQYPNGTYEYNSEDIFLFSYLENKGVMNQDLLSEAIFTYMLSLPKEEEAAGLLRMELLSFSERCIVLHKVYEKDKRECYYLASAGDYLVVLYPDQETIYINTGIKVSDLPVEIRNEIMEMKILYGQEEVFHFLETLTS